MRLIYDVIAMSTGLPFLLRDTDIILCVYHSYYLKYDIICYNINEV